MENLKTAYKSVLSIAGSDSGGCAGIQADIKSISACNAYAATVITATTAQNTQGVFDIYPLPISHIEKQLDAVLSDIKFSAVKIGMLHSCEVIKCVQEKLEEYDVKNIVIDPVMIAKSGHILINKDAISCLELFLNKATLITPNIHEAELLIGYKINIKNAEKSAKEIGLKYKTSVLLKGGYLNETSNRMTDILYLQKQEKILLINNPIIVTNNVHGTGCSLSSSIAAFLSLDYSIEEAVEKGCNYVNLAIKNGEHKILGKGNGPINHFNLK